MNCTYYLGYMSCLISFVRAQSSCEEYDASENSKHEKLSNLQPSNSEANIKPLDYLRLVKTF